MDIVISHRTALRYWRSLGVNGPFPALVDPIEASSILDESAPMLLRRFPSEIGSVELGRPLDVLCRRVPRADADGELQFHGFGGTLPERGLMRVAPGMFVTTPELTLALLAQEMSLAQVAAVGCELCGTYRQVETMGEHPTTFARLCSRDRLSQMASQLSRMKGLPTFRRATRWVLEDSGSPRETALALMLCLPCLVGGYGLPAPLLNATYDIPVQLRRSAGKSSYRVDVAWPDSNFGLEYDSDAEHAGASSLAADANRRKVLRQMGVDVISVTRAMLSSASEFDQVARLGARELGVRLSTHPNERSEKVLRKRVSLLSELKYGYPLRKNRSQLR